MGKNIRSSSSPKALATSFPMPPLADAMDAVRLSVDRFCLLAGVEALAEMMEEDATTVCGTRHRRHGNRRGYRWGHTQSEIGYHGGRVKVQRPRVRDHAGKGVGLESWQVLRDGNLLLEWATGIICDQTISLDGFYTRQDYPELLRRIRFKDPESGKTLVFITNNFSLPAATICALYKSRWQVELFFKWIKQHLRIKQFYGTSENAVKTQIWIAVSVYVLVAIVKKRLDLDASTTSPPSTGSMYARPTPSRARSPRFVCAPTGPRAACRARRRWPWSLNYASALRENGENSMDRTISPRSFAASNS